LRALERRREELTARVQEAESRVSEIDELFCRPGYFEQTATSEVAARRRERTALEEEVASLIAEWEGLEDEIEQLTRSRSDPYIPTS
jgi:cell division septum initiation protein DivIVA